jgi:GLPGLI family protein
VLDTSEIVVVYSMEYVQDTNDPDFTGNVDMFLFLGQSKSYFLSKEFYSFDTIMRRIANFDQFQQFVLDPDRPFPKFSYMVYKNYPEGKLTFIDHIPSDTYSFTEELFLFNWQLMTDTATIKGYKVQKATCDFGGRIWIAWFSPEIPYNDGPYKFNGLPGLILKVHDTRHHYNFELISLKHPEKDIMIDIKDKDYIETTKFGFFRAKDNFREDIINRAKDAGLNSQSQQTAARNMARRNNPIEVIRKEQKK